MRTISTDMDRLLTSGAYNVKVIVEIEDQEGALQDITNFKGHNWFIDATISDDVDSQGPSATINIQKAIYNDNLAPGMTNSRLNINLASDYEARIDLKREVVITINCSPFDPSYDTSSIIGSDIEIFRGQIDKIDVADTTITLTCRDQIAQLADTWIEEDGVYSNPDPGEAVEDVLQEILDDWVDSPPTIITPTTPGWFILEFGSTAQSVIDQLTLLTDQIGWNLRYKWDETAGPGAFRLVFYGPDRESDTSLRTFSPSSYYEIQQLSIDIEGIRNRIRVSYPNPDDLDADGTPKLVDVIVEDTDSQDRFGVRFMGITEASSSNINTITESTAMAEAMLSDLAFPDATHQVSMPFFFAVELEDIYTFLANDDHYDTSIKCAVTGYVHTLSSDVFETSLTLRQDGIIGKTFDYWNEWNGLPGFGPPKYGREFSTSDHTLKEDYGSLSVGWKGSNPNRDNTTIANKTNLHYEVYVTNPGELPTPDRLVAITKEPYVTIPTGPLLPVNEEQDIHIISVHDGVASAPITLPNKIVQQFGDKHLNDSVLGDAFGYEQTFNQNTNGEDHFCDGVEEVEVGEWGEDVYLDDGTDYGTGTNTHYHGSQGLLIK